MRALAIGLATLLPSAPCFGGLDADVAAGAAPRVGSRNKRIIAEVRHA